ncbi:MAG: hypothetical protein JW900_13080 [Anaerolineae bacterium]|nr:hypothetical protein [Anaerolineae bacterium]
MNWTPFAGFAAALVLLFFMERWVHRHLQGLMLLLANDADVATVLYALPLLPGVILHETSHALAGLLVGARVGRISILPKKAGGRIQLGFVPVEATGAVRTALIGLAPLIAGCLALLLIGYLRLGLGSAALAVAAGDWELTVSALREAMRSNNFWLWAYLAFSVSNTMLPSRSDMRAWPVLLIFLLASAALVALLGLGPALVGPLTSALRWLAIACGLTILVDLPFVLLIMLLEWAIGKARGVRLQYQ